MLSAIRRAAFVPINHSGLSQISCVVRAMSSDLAEKDAEYGPVEASIRAKLTELLSPTTMVITNDSWKHRHHAPMKAQGGGNGETHFSIQVISDEFKGKNSMQRHRMIYGVLTEEFASGLHALSLVTKTPEEVSKS